MLNTALVLFVVWLSSRLPLGYFKIFPFKSDGCVNGNPRTDYFSWSVLGIDSALKSKKGNPHTGGFYRVHSSLPHALRRRDKQGDVTMNQRNTAITVTSKQKVSGMSGVGESQAAADFRLEKIPAAADRMCISIAQAYREIKAGRLGTIVKVGARSSALRSADVDRWIMDRLIESQGRAQGDAA